MPGWASVCWWGEIVFICNTCLSQVLFVPLFIFLFFNFFFFYYYYYNNHRHHVLFQLLNCLSLLPFQFSSPQFHCGEVSACVVLHCRLGAMRPSYRASWLHHSAGGMLVPSSLLSPPFRDWVVPEVCRQAQFYCQSADVDKTVWPKCIRKISFSFFVLVMLKNMKKGLCHSLARL